MKTTLFHTPHSTLRAAATPNTLAGVARGFAATSGHYSPPTTRYSLLLLAFSLQAFSLLLPAATVYWDTGATGTWFTPNGWHNGSATGALRDAPGTGDGAYIDGGCVTIGTGLSVTTGGSRLGSAVGTSGTVIVAGLWQSANDIHYGYAGDGFLIIETTGTVINAQGFIGRQGTATGTVFVSGFWQNNSNLAVGNGGAGWLRIEPSGTVTNPSGYIGQNAGVTGTAIVAGLWRNSDTLFVGASGNGWLDIAATGTVINTTGYIGQNAGSTGTAIVAGLWQNTGDLYVGNSGAGTLIITGSGSLRASSITLATTGTSRGTLEIAGNGAHSITLADGVTLADIVGGAGTGGASILFSHANPALDFNNKLTGALTVEVNGPGLTTLTGDNDYTGGNIVRSGTLAGTPASIRGDILADGAVSLATPAAHTLALTGTGAFNKLGAGTLTLAPASNFTGAFNIAAGSVALDGAASLDNARAVTLASGGTLSASLSRAAGQTLSAAAGSAITGNVSINNASLELAPSSPGASAFSIGGNLTFANSTLKLGLFDEAGSIISIGGSAIISGVNTIDLTPGMSGAYTLAGLGALAGSDITIDGIAQAGGGSRQVATGTASGADLLISFESDISRALAWTGSSSANWNIADENWAGSNNTQIYANLDTVVFDSTSDSANPASRSITLAGNTPVSDIIVTGGEDYTFAGTGSIISSTTIITETGNPENLTGVTGKLYKSGAGKLTFANTGANNFSGGIEITGGALVFNNAAQLGTLTATGTSFAPITLSGGTLNPVASATLDAPLAITTAAAPASAIEAPASVTLTLAGSVSGAGSLEKTGAGSLVFAAENTHTGSILVNAGTLATRAENLRGPVVNNASLVLDAGGDNEDAFTGAISGNGALSKTGAATLAFTGAAAADTITISQGAIRINELASLAAASTFTIAPGAQLVGTGAFSAPQFTNAGTIKVGRAANPSEPHGVMTLTGNYTGAAGSEIHLDMSLDAAGVMEFDRFIINGNAGGVTNVSLQEQPSAARLDGDTSLLPALGDMLAVTGSAAPGALVHAGVVEFGAGQYQWDNALNNGAGGWRTLVAEPATAIGALDAASIIIGKAAFASLENRLLAARETNIARKNQFWLSGFHRHENLDAVRYDTLDTTPRRLDANTQGVQAGVDWLSVFFEPDYTFVFGLSVDYAKSDMRLPGRATTGSTRSSAGGPYAMWKMDKWHIHAFARYANEDYEVAAARVAPFSTSGYSWGGLAAIGYDFETASGWRIEPEFRYFYQTHKIKGATDAAGRHYNLESADTREIRASIRLARVYAWRNGLKLIPHIRGGWTHDFGGEGRLGVAGDIFRNDFGGSGGEADAGVLMELGRGAAIQFETRFFQAKSTDGYHITASFGYAW